MISLACIFHPGSNCFQQKRADPFVRPSGSLRHLAVCEPDSYTENLSEQDSDSLSDEGLGQEAQGGHRSDEDEFLDCEPTPSGNLEAFERSSAVTSTRHAITSVADLLHHDFSGKSCVWSKLDSHYLQREFPAL